MQVMSEWLSDKKLDRKLLGTMAANLAAVEAWDDFQSDEVLNVLEELVADVAGEPREAPAPLQLLEGPDEEASHTLMTFSCESCVIRGMMSGG